MRVYRRIFDCFTEHSIVVRTLDIGGDKAVSYLGIIQEANPFLGWRAIRMNEGRPEILRGQLRALLRAGAGKNLRIMVPMISNLGEVLQAKQMLAEASRSLQAEGISIPGVVQFGIMVEVPSRLCWQTASPPMWTFLASGRTISPNIPWL